MKRPAGKVVQVKPRCGPTPLSFEAWPSQACNVGILAFLALPVSGPPHALLTPPPSCSAPPEHPPAPPSPPASAPARSSVPRSAAPTGPRSIFGAPANSGRPAQDGEHNLQGTGEKLQRRQGDDFEVDGGVMELRLFSGRAASSGSGCPEATSTGIDGQERHV